MTFRPAGWICSFPLLGSFVLFVKLIYARVTDELFAKVLHLCLNNGDYFE